jgi:hypothetical protein
MGEEKIRAHSAAEGDDAPCGVQFGLAEDVTAHSAAEGDDAPCGVQFGLEAEDVTAHSADDDTPAEACGVQFG